jgi:Erg28 like protein
VSLVSVLNSIQAYSTLVYTQQVYTGSKASKTGSPATPLSSRTFGTWTVLSAVVRFYAAYHISNPQIYQLAFWTYAIAFVHFNLEWFVFKTASWGKGLGGPVVVSTGTLLWMLSQWDYYVN